MPFLEVAEAISTFQAQHFWGLPANWRGGKPHCDKLDLMEILVLLTALRLLVPLLILRWPIFGMLASMYLDLQDFNYFTIRTEQDMTNYQTWDKVMDIYYLSIAFYTSLSWKEKLAKKISIFFFSLRALGVVVLLFVHARELLLFFPNIFENFFLFYLLFKTFTNNARLFTSVLATSAILACIIIPKVIAEYYLHILLSPTIFNLPRTIITPFFPTSIEDLTIYTLYIGPTIAVLIWRIIVARKSASL